MLVDGWSDTEFLRRFYIRWTMDNGRGRWTIVGYFGGRTAVEPILGVSLYDDYSDVFASL